jgi:hypothetical protein
MCHAPHQDSLGWCWQLVHFLQQDLALVITHVHEKLEAAGAGGAGEGEVQLQVASLPGHRATW